MGLFFFICLLLIFFGVLPFGLAMLATLLLSIIYLGMHCKRKSIIYEQLIQLVLLRLALKDHYLSKPLKASTALNQKIDALFTQLCQQLPITTHERRLKIDAAWQMLKEQDGLIPDVPPWHVTSTTASRSTTMTLAEEKLPTLATQAESQAVASPESTSITFTSHIKNDKVTSSQEEIPPIKRSPITNHPPTQPIEKSEQPEAKSPPRTETQQPVLAQQPASAKPARKPVWLRFIHKIILPFLWQNIGWFIGGFCLVSGSIFLVTNSHGFANAIIVLLNLSFYTLLLFWGSYQIQRYRPSLRLVSTVLATLAVLLVPLDFAAGVRLLHSSLPHLWRLSVALLMALSIVGLLTFATRLASGLIERRLPHEHTYLFIALAGLQFVLPLFYFIPHWILLAVLHLSLLAILGYALWHFSRQWLHAIFIEQQKTTYYAAGVLAYAAVVTFLHLTWGSHVDLPVGYSGPFLMLLGLLLLHVDTQLKQWVHKHVLLGHFSFVIYAISVVAILLAAAAKLPLTLTLSLGSILYGRMLWQYLTLPPLYLLFACLSGLYAQHILHYWPYHSYFLASLPGLAIFALVYRFAQKRQSEALAIICCRVILGLGISLLVWSLYHAMPSVIGMLTAAVASLIVLGLRAKPLDGCQIAVLKPYADYIIPVTATLTLAYAPLYSGISWVTQFSFSLLGLAIVWTISFFLATAQKTILLNSALFSVLLSIALIAFFATPIVLPWGLLVASSVLLGLSLGLRNKPLFYLTLLSMAGMVALLKYHYFPLSSGWGTLLLALGIWLLLWGLHYRFHYLSTPVAENILEKSDTVIFGLLPFYHHRNRVDMVKQPLQQALIVLWLVGLWRLFQPLNDWLFTGSSLVLEPSWARFAFVGAVTTGLVAGQLRQSWLAPLFVLLLLGAITVFSSTSLHIPFTYLPVLVAIYALGVELTKRRIFMGLSACEAGLGWHICDQRQSIGYFVHNTVFVLSLISVLLALAFSPLLAQVITLAIATLFFSKSGWHYRSLQHSYFALGAASSVLLAAYTHALIMLPTLGYLTALLAIVAATGANRLTSTTRLAKLYRLPLYHVAFFYYFGALIIGFGSWHLGWTQPIVDHHFSVLLVLLALGQLPLLRFFPNIEAANIRSISVAVLLSLAYFNSCYTFDQSSNSLFFFALLWSFVLWGLGHYGLPWFNHRWPQWRITPVFWPLLGLGLTLSALIGLSLEQNQFTWQTFLPSTLYLLFMLRDPPWNGLPWLAGLAVMLSGLVVLLDLWPNDLTLLLIFGLVLWVYLLERLATVLAHYNNYRWQLKQLADVLSVGVIGLLSLQLLFVGAFTIANLFDSPFLLHDEIATLLAIWSTLLVFSFGHLFLKRRASILLAHIFLLALLNLAVLLFWPNLLLLSSLWLITLLSLRMLVIKYPLPQINQTVLPILADWLSFSFGVALFSSIGLDITTHERLFALFLLAGFSFSFGWLTVDLHAKIWLAISAVLCGIALHFSWFVALPQATGLALLPVYALQDILLAWGILNISRFLQNLPAEKQAHIQWLLDTTVFWLSHLALFSWFIAGVYLINAPLSIPPLFGGKIAQIMTLLTGLLLVHLWQHKRLTHILLMGALSWLTLQLAGVIFFAVAATPYNLSWPHSEITTLRIWAITLACAISYLFIKYNVAHLFAHIVLLSLFNFIILLCHTWLDIPSLLSLWLGGLLLIAIFVNKNQSLQISQAVLSVLPEWLSLSFGITLFSLIGLDIGAYERLYLLSLLAVFSFSFGGLNLFPSARLWLAIGAVLGGVVLHLSWLTILPQAVWLSLLPWFALQNTLLAWSMLRAAHLLPSMQQEKQANLRWLLKVAAFWLGSIAGLSWLISTVYHINSPTLIPYLWGIGDQLAVLCTGLLFIRLWWHYSPVKYNKNNEITDLFIYGFAILVGWLGLYLRLLGLGTVPLNVWDTTLLMIGSYGLLALQHRYSTVPALYRLTLLLPTLALLTVPFQLESVPATIALVAAATLYLLMPRQRKLPLYLGLLAMNLGVYLWIPSLATHYHLLQIYTVPAAITVLLMLQLHQLELKPSVLNATRLAALSTLYASATLDVFLRAELSIFILALGLSLLGVVLGIIMRMRAFLYAGTVFLILNVLGQLIQFYPEGRLAKALILMSVGSLIIGGMIGFNMQREAIMQRFRMMRGDLATWE